jgi:polysaccharide biosynthesis transport protein
MKSMRELAPYQEPPRGPMRGAAAEANPIRRMPAVNPEQTFFHFDLVRALELHRGLAVGILLAAVVASGAYLARRWNNYKAESLVYVQPAPPHLLESAQGQQSWPFDANTYESYIQQQIHNVTREDVLADAVGRIPGFQGEKERLQAAADRLDGNIQVDRVSTGYQIAITATAGSAGEAAEMANAVAQSFIDKTTKELRSGDAQRIALLGEERDRVMKELASDRTEQDALNKQLGVAAVGTATPDPYDDQIAAVRAELVKARTDHDEAAAKLTATAGGGPSSAALDAAADEIVAADPGLVSMKTALNKRRSDLISQMANLTPQHPLYKQDAQELATINVSLDAMSKDLRTKAATEIEQKLKSDLERTAGVEDRLNAQLGQLTSAAGSATPRLQRANDLATDIARLQARFSTVDEQYRNLTIDNAAPGAVYLSAPAIAPLHADRKKVYRNALIVLLAGLIFALAAALIAHNLDPRIYIAADVERVLGFAPMALLPDLYEVGTGVAEEYMLRLSAAVEHAHQQGHLNSCIFTGVAPGAGATTVATRVSSMLQAMGRATALVDAVGTAPQENDDAGSGLVHMPRGSRSTALLQQVTAGNDETIVVTDTAPLTISAETEYLARFVDSAIVVIESGTTTKAQLREVAQTLERLDVSAVGFVLNRISMAKGNAGFCRSVHAVEKHLKAQARTFDRKHSRGATPAADDAEVAERSAGNQGWEAAAEPANGGARAEAAEEEPRSGKEFIAAHETMFVNQPHAAAEDRPAARTAAIHSPGGWEAESIMSPERTNNSEAERASWEMRAFEFRAEEADGFLPWEAGPALAIRERFARSTRVAYEGVSAGVGTETLDGEPASPSIAEDADLISSDRQAAEESAAEPLNAAVLQETMAQLSESPTYAGATAEGRVPDDLNQPVLETLQAPEQTAPPDEAATPEDSEANPAQGWKAIPAKPARGREGVQVVLGGPRTAPLTGEEVPEKWREMLQSEADVAYPAAPPEERVPFSPESLETAQVRTDPFDAMREASARRAPLVEWWEELTASAKQAPVADAPKQAAAAAPVAQAAAADQATRSDATPIAEQDEALSHAASRLNGLRNLLVSLGIETLHQGMEQRKAESEARAAKAAERAIFAQPASPAGSGRQASDSVTARGEIMPPRLEKEAAQREKPAKTPLKSPRVSSWESPDDVDILPSRRGQYRRSR